jgi:conjugal transfer pilus assembly protein TraA
MELNMQTALPRVRSARHGLELLLLASIAAVLLTAIAYAGTDATFTPAVTKITGWTQGSLGKLAAVAGISGALVGMVLKFDWKMIGGALGIGLTAATGATITSGLATAIL